MDELTILRAFYETLKRADEEFFSTGDEASEDLMYLSGALDMVKALLPYKEEADDEDSHGEIANE